MKKVCLAMCLALCSGSVLAADFGLGVSYRTDEGTIYAPIDISKSFRIEPSVLYFSNNNDAPGPDSPYTSKDQRREAGVGVFGITEVAESARFYWGGRLSYVDVERSSYNDLLTSNGFSRTELDGYSIAPTVGFEYRFGKHFSLGGEASYIINKLEGDGYSRTVFVPNLILENYFDAKDDSQTTRGRIIVRYTF